MFRRRIWVVFVVVVVEESLGERAKKKLFSHKKKNLTPDMTVMVVSWANINLFE
jgi:hypothetical protein